MSRSQRQRPEDAETPVESLFHRAGGRSGELAQIPRNLLFRYRFPCPRVEKVDIRRMFALPESCRLVDVSRLEGRPAFAQWRVGWNDNGLYLTSIVGGKRQPLWCRPTEILESDSLRVWIDTRDTHNVHRATRFCHWFVSLPTGPQGQESASCRMLRINRAREDSPTLNRGEVTVHGMVKPSGYQLAIFIPGALLNGWSPTDQPNIGFFVAQVDREFGWQTLGTGPELPISDDPSLWSTLLLRP